MTLLDVMIAVGGLTEFADGNGASVVRIVDGQQQQYGIRIKDLIQGGDISANVDLLPVISSSSPNPGFKLGIGCHAGAYRAA